MSNPYGQQYDPNRVHPSAHGAPPPGYGTVPPHHHQQMRNGLGIAALVIGIIGVLTGVIPILFFASGTLGLLAVIFGFVGRARASRGTASNGGLALSGAILGLISMGLATWGLVVTVSAVGDAATRLDKALASATASPEGADPSPTKSQARKPIPLGAVTKEPPFSLKVVSVSREQTVSSSIDSHKAQGSYVVVRVLVKNTGNSPASFDGTDSGLLDSDSKQYNVDSNATISQNLETGQGLYDEINPGQKVTRVLVFDLPKKAKPVVIAMFGAEGSDGAFMYLVKNSELASPA
ncbi:DUF4190 domain-containing protein [Nonomuraea rubra]|uniref:DUF4352 domain-containing protein n=1 Tax=Nonomuraea rubra TaxID=46180 RepID=A0A7X0TX39_9ACTN|nr:DUF4190 domain-containing protein [Nonomuraea rubra]MBB6547051.1 hypothetical protein [Nonomuraea rubra]